MEPNWEIHKHFSINYNVFFTCYIEGISSSFSINTNWSGCTHTLVHKPQLVGGFDPLFSQLQLKMKHQLPCRHQPALALPNHPYFLNLENFCIMSSLHLSLLLWFNIFWFRLQRCFLLTTLSHLYILQNGVSVIHCFPLFGPSHLFV